MPGVDSACPRHVQIELFTRLRIKRYEIENTPFSVPIESGCSELNDLLKSLLLSGDDNSSIDVVFDFLIEGEYLQTSIQEYVSCKNVSTESTIKIEYTLQQESPQLSHSLLHNDWVSSVDIRNNLILTGSYDNSVKVWNTDGECLTTINGHTMAVRKVIWNTSTESFISASQDQTALIWQYNPEDCSSQAMHICKGHTRSVDCLAVNPSCSKFASGSWDKMIKIWEAGIDSNAGNENESDPKRVCKKEKDNPKVRTPLLTLSGHKEPVSSLIWTDDQELISAGWDHCIRLWDVSTSNNKHTLTGNKVILSIAYSSKNRLLASGNADKFVRLFDVRASDDVVHKMLSSHEGWVAGVDWSPNNEHILVSGSYDCTIKLWDIRCTSEPIHTLGKHGDKVMCVSWKESNYVLSGAADCCLNIYEYSLAG